MELNRTHYMMIGLVLLAMGIQFRRVESFVLTERATEVIAKRLKTQDTATSAFIPAFTSGALAPQRVVKPPRWLGYVLLSAGGVMVLHSLAMPKPG
jgi:hypothetical protein